MDAQFPVALGLLAALLGGVVGLSLGLVGAGGSILTVPALIYGLGVPVQEAIPAALVLVGVIAASGALHHTRDGTVRFDIALRFGLAGVVGALLGAPLSKLVSPRMLMILFAFVMLAAAVNLARRDNSRAAAEDGSAEHDPGWLRLLLAGLVVGVMTGFFGVGGGFIIVPALVLFVGLPTRKAVATSLVVIVINCIAGLAGHLTMGSGISRTVVILLVLFGIGGTLGSFGGARLAGKWPDKVLSRIFAGIITVVAVYLLIRNLPGAHQG